MPYALLAIAVFVLVVFALPRLATANPQIMARNLRVAAGAGAISLAGVLALRGALPLAIPLFLGGLALMGKQGPLGNVSWGPFGSARRSPGQKSAVSTAMLRMELDHDSGTMDGDILAGRFEGRRLASLSLDEALAVYQECRAATDQSSALMEAWLDRIHPDWRKSAEAGQTRSKPAGAGRMSRAEALSVLGLEDGASEAEIKAAHRRMMKKYHPDHGGSDYLAAKINQAKAVLLPPTSRRSKG